MIPLNPSVSVIGSVKKTLLDLSDLHCPLVSFSDRVRLKDTSVISDKWKSLR